MMNDSMWPDLGTSGSEQAEPERRPEPQPGWPFHFGASDSEQAEPEPQPGWLFHFARAAVLLLFVGGVATLLALMFKAIRWAVM